MDQMASSVGSMVFIDFKSTEKPVVEKLEFDLKNMVMHFVLLIQELTTQI